MVSHGHVRVLRVTCEGDEHSSSHLSYFKIGTPAGEWAKDKQITALALSPPNFGTWDAFKDDFKSHFISVDQVLLFTQQMHSMKMGNRPFSDWYL